MLTKPTSGLLVRALLVTALVLVVTAPSKAEVANEGDLLVRLHGGVILQARPQTGPVPAKLRVRARFETTDPFQFLPALSRIELKLPRRVQLRSEGLDRCPLDELLHSSETRAQNLCGSAEVGRGEIEVGATFPGQASFHNFESLVAFNGRYRGRPAMLAHVTSGPPLPTSYVIIFSMSRPHGRLQTRLVAKVPGANGYRHTNGGFEIDKFALRLGRMYRIGKVRRSYVSASCADPAWPSPAISVSFEFADTRTLTGNLPEICTGTRGVGGGK